MRDFVLCLLQEKMERFWGVIREIAPVGWEREVDEKIEIIEVEMFERRNIEDDMFERIGI